MFAWIKRLFGKPSKTPESIFVNGTVCSFKTGEELRPGMMIYINDKGEVGLPDLSTIDNSLGVIGIAAREIKKDEIIEYSPIKNTKDVIVYAKGFIKHGD
jgi:hypothetical protein